MTRADFHASVAAATGLDMADVQRVVDQTFEAIASALVAGKTVNIQGFGTFGVRTIPGKRARCTTTGELMWRPARRAPHFRPGQVLDARVDI